MFSIKFMRNPYFRRLAVFTFIALILNPAQADLILSSPPRESEEAGNKLYQPLADELTVILNEKVIYEHPKSYLFYQRDLRADKYDIIFDGPHFISWRAKKFNHTPIAKLPGTFGFIVVTAKGTKGFLDAELNDLTQLYNVATCAIAPPNLSTLSVLEQFKSPWRRPKIISVKGGMDGVLSSFKQGKCKAAIFRDKFYQGKVPQAEKENLKIIFTSQNYSNQGISVSSRVNPRYHALLTEALTKESPALAPIIKRFAAKAKTMQPATISDYENYFKLLTEVIYGWDIEEK